MNPATNSQWLRWRRRLSSSIARTLPWAARLLPTSEPMATLHHAAPTRAARSLLVFLPGTGDLPGEVNRHGLAEAAWKAGITADVIETDLHLGYYLRHVAVERLHDEVVRSARARGYGRIWLIGFDLGGWGALLYAHRHPDEVDGVVVIAPTDPGAASNERRLIWQWLLSGRRKPPIYLGFGEWDRAAAHHRLVAEMLPTGHVTTVPGGVDWATRARLWNTMLNLVVARLKEKH